MVKPLISIIMPNLNGAKRLVSAIESVRVQNYGHFELIVVDGYSSDGSHDILRNITSKDTRIRWLCETEQGLSDAINRGIRAARGELIGYLGNDDEYLPGIFEHVAWMAERVDFDALMFSSYTYFVKEKTCVLRVPAAKEVTPETLLEFGTVVGLQNVFYRMRVFKAHLFDVQNKYSMDYQLLWDLALDATKRLFVFSDQVASINYFEGNLSHDNLQQEHEAMAIARARQGDYAGSVWFQRLLPPLPSPPPPSKLNQRLRRCIHAWLGCANKAQE